MHINFIKYFPFIFIIVSIFFFALGSYPLLNNNEGLYAEIPKEMLESGNWIIPYLNDVIYIEKPPLLYWLIALSYQTFGVSEWSARLIPATSGIFTCLIILWFSLKLNLQKLNWLSSFILSTSFGYIICSRMVFFDILLTFFVTTSLLFFYLWFKEEKLTFLRISYISLALAVLSKGLVAIILAGGVVLIFFVIEKVSLKKIKTFFDLTSILLFLLITLPWHIAAIIQEEGFAWFFFVNEHFLRFLGLKEPKDFYSGAIYYYLIKIPLYLFPWSLFLFILLKKTTLSSKLARFCWIWILFFLAFFSLSTAKANYYLILGLPPLTLLLANKIEYLLRNKPSLIRFISAISGTFILIIFIIINYSYENEKIKLFTQYIHTYWPIFFSVYIVTNIIIMYFKKKLQYLPIIFIGSLSFFFLLLILQIMPKVKDHFSAQWVSEKVPKEYHDNIFVFHDFENLSAIPFYTKKNVKIINSFSKDLYYGSKRPSRSKIFFSLEEFNKICLTKTAFIVIYSKYIPEMITMCTVLKIDSRNKLNLLATVPAHPIKF